MKKLLTDAVVHACIHSLQGGEGGGRGQVCSVGHGGGTHKGHGEALQGLEGHAPPRVGDEGVACVRRVT